MTETKPEESPKQPESPTVVDKTKRPSGIVPKNAQAWVTLGIGGVMILAISLSGTKTARQPESLAKPPTSGVVDPNEARIREYRDRIEADARRIAAEQERLRHAQAELGLLQSQQPPGTASTVAPTSPGITPATTPAPAYSHPPERESRPEKSASERDRERREYESLYASNVALTLRPRESAGNDAAPPAGRQGQPVANNLMGPYGLFPANNAWLPTPPPQGQAAGPAPSPNVPAPHPVAAPDSPKLPATTAPRVNSPAQGNHVLFEGTILEAVLTNRLSGAFSGPVNCMITTDAWSRDGQHLLIPRGSRALGEVDKVEHLGQERLAVRFHRLVLPDGRSVALDRFPGMNQIGETGLRDKVDRHFLQAFGASLAVGALSGLAQYNTRYGFDVSAGDYYRQGVSRSLADSSGRILDRYLNVLPTFTIREGHRVRIYLTRDLELPACDEQAGLTKP
jgi:type IV secretion system protein TrbI